MALFVCSGSHPHARAPPVHDCTWQTSCMVQRHASLKSGDCTNKMYIFLRHRLVSDDTTDCLFVINRLRGVGVFGTVSEESGDDAAPAHAFLFSISKTARKEGIKWVSDTVHRD